MTTIGTRQRLIEAAEKELIRSHGHLEMQAVSKRAQASVGLAYHHFGSKAGLIAAVVEAFYSRLDEMAFKDRCSLPSFPLPTLAKSQVAGRTGKSGE